MYHCILNVHLWDDCSSVIYSQEQCIKNSFISKFLENSCDMIRRAHTVLARPKAVLAVFAGCSELPEENT